VKQSGATTVRSLSGGTGVGADVEGLALVSRHGFGVRYDLDPATGLIANPQHDLYGESLRDKILVFPFPKGGVAAAWALAELAERGIGPLGIVFRNASPVFVQGAVFAAIAILHHLREDPVEHVRNGDRVRLRPRAGTLEIVHRVATPP